MLGIVTLYQIFYYTLLWPVVPLSWTYHVEWKTPERGGRDLLIHEGLLSYYPRQN